jgi:hypothetical protein
LAELPLALATGTLVFAFVLAGADGCGGFAASAATGRAAAIRATSIVIFRIRFSLLRELVGTPFLSRVHYRVISVSEACSSLVKRG